MFARARPLVQAAGTALPRVGAAGLRLGGNRGGAAAPLLRAVAQPPVTRHRRHYATVNDDNGPSADDGTPPRVPGDLSHLANTAEFKELQNIMQRNPGLLTAGQNLAEQMKVSGVSPQDGQMGALKLAKTMVTNAEFRNAVQKFMEELEKAGVGPNSNPEFTAKLAALAGHFGLKK